MVGQNLDKFLTNVKVLSNFCPCFVQVLSMSNICLSSSDRVADYAPNFHRPELALKQNEGESRVVIMSRKRGRKRKREQPIIALATQKKEGQVLFIVSLRASERGYFASRIGGRREGEMTLLQKA